MRTDRQPRVVVVGAGPAGLIAATVLAQHVHVELYEQGRNVGRKFLVAGDGGLNITNQAVGEALLAHYSHPGRMRPILEAFDPTALRTWLASLGIPTFIGTSGRVFPLRGIKPAEVLKAMVAHVRDRGVPVRTGHKFVGFDDQKRPILENDGQRVVPVADAYLFALGGASWPKTGSTGTWVAAFASIGVDVRAFEASNCGVEVDLPANLLPHVGKPLKNIATRCGAKAVRGELTITEHGLEGNAIYPLISAVRDGLGDGKGATIIVDLKPDLSEERIAEKLRGAAWKERSAALRLDRPALAFMKSFTPMERFLDGRTLAHDVKNVHVPVQGLRPIEEAISTRGGISWDALNEDLSIRGHPHLVVAGEMIDWDAPTGGFLLQGAFSTGCRAARG
ncbi:MAG: NAD(P)/FAD-dependent oxidoreductase, partial [Flavobacteriales bacterium]